MLKEGTKLNAIVPSFSIAAIIPQSFDEVVRFARLVIAAGLHQGHKDGDKEAQASVSIMHGMEVGIPPLQAVTGIAIINGKPCIHSDLVPALLWSKGFELDEEINGEGDNIVAVCTVTRPNGKKITREWSAKKAVTAGLWDPRKKVKRYKKDGTSYEVDNDSPWHLYPDRMVQMRARGFACRDGASDVMRGMYLREEMEYAARDEGMRDITPDRSPMIPTKEFIDPPKAPPVEEAKPAQETKQEEPQATATVQEPVQSEDLLTELRVALQGAKTEDESLDAWDELSERICSAGMKVRDKGQAILGEHLGKLPKLIEAKQEMPATAFIPSEAAAFDMMSVPAAE